MELREWLIILGLALVSLIVVDGVRRLQRQRRVPRLDQAVKDLPTAKLEELDDEAKEAEINWELPNGGARVVKPADYSGLGRKPKLERQEHPGPSKVLSDFRRSFKKATTKSAPTGSVAAPTEAAAKATVAKAPISKGPVSKLLPLKLLWQRKASTTSRAQPFCDGRTGSRRSKSTCSAGRRSTRRGSATRACCCRSA